MAQNKEVLISTSSIHNIIETCHALTIFDLSEQFRFCTKEVSYYLSVVYLKKWSILIFIQNLYTNFF